MNLTGRNDRIAVICTGPYILYMDVCFKSLHSRGGIGYLRLLVMGEETPLSSTTLNTSNGDLVCQGHQSTVYLRARQQASLYLCTPNMFKIKTVTLGLHYLLGSQCYY